VLVESFEWGLCAAASAYSVAFDWGLRAAVGLCSPVVSNLHHRALGGRRRSAYSIAFEWGVGFPLSLYSLIAYSYY